MCRKKCNVIWESVNVEYPENDIKDFIEYQIRERKNKINLNIDLIKNAKPNGCWDLNAIQHSINYNEKMIEILNIALEKYSR